MRLHYDTDSSTDSAMRIILMIFVDLIWNFCFGILNYNTLVLIQILPPKSSVYDGINKNQ